MEMAFTVSADISAPHDVYVQSGYRFRDLQCPQGWEWIYIQ